MLGLPIAAAARVTVQDDALPLLTIIINREVGPKLYIVSLFSSLFPFFEMEFCGFLLWRTYC